MAAEDIVTALQRVESVLRRRPEAGVHDDAPASARWQSDCHTVVSHPNGARIATDMPSELGGSGEEVTAGWLVRAGLASCTATRIAMMAAAEGIALTELEVKASSRSDVRGLLHMAGEDGEPVYPGSCDVKLRIRIAAAGVPDQRLRALVERSNLCSPMLAVVQDQVPVSVQIEVTA